jgi:hypothetical protein
MHSTRGATEIGSLTDDLGCSRRYLIGLFNDRRSPTGATGRR